MKYSCFRCGCYLEPIQGDEPGVVYIAHRCTAEPSELEDQVRRIIQPDDDVAKRFERLCEFEGGSIAVAKCGTELLDEIRRLRRKRAADLVLIDTLKTHVESEKVEISAAGFRPSSLEGVIVQAIDIARESGTDAGKRILSLLESALEEERDPR